MAADLQDVLLAEEGMQQGRGMRIDIQAVSYFVPSDKGQQRQVLASISHSIPANKLTALMGKSGSGKTSLLTLLRGLGAKGTRSSGRVLLDGQAITPNITRETTRFVAQEDVFLPGLTPRETLSFVAELRLRKWTAQQRAERVESILKLLDLMACADTRVGDPSVGLIGCSGGERKRLSIAVSIVGGLPSVLLCDEPTSGLDAASAEVVVKMLRQVADKGVTVVASIHQPSYALVCEFHEMLILTDGRLAYAGLVSEAEAFFEKAGYPVPRYENPADHYLKVIGGEEWWKTATAAGTLDAAVPQSDKKVTRVDVTRAKANPFTQQISVLLRRNMRENLKNKKRFFAGCMARLPPSVMIGMFYWQAAAKMTNPYIFTTMSLCFLALQNPLIDCFYAGVASFFQQVPLFKREYYDGLYSVAPFYIAYYAAYLCMMVPWAILWSTPLYLLAGFPIEVRGWILFVAAVLSTMFLGTAIGSIFAAASPDIQTARTQFIIFMIPSALFSGFVIPYNTLSVAWKWCYYLSPLQWGLSLMARMLFAGCEFSDCPPGSRGCYSSGDQYLTDTGRTYSIGTMLAICFSLCVFAVGFNVIVSTRKILDGSA